MAHPSDLYIKFLIAKSRGENKRLNCEALNKIFKTFLLPETDQEHFLDLAKGLVFPKSFNFKNHGHKTTERFMKGEGIYELWNPDANIAGMFELMLQPNAKETIQILLIGRVPLDIITTKVNARYKLSLTQETVVFYQRFFWNTERVAIEEWDKLLNGSPLKWSYMVSLSCSPNQALFRAGFNPSINHKKALAEAFLNLAMRVEATRTFKDSSKVTNSLTRLTQQLVYVHDAIYSEGAGIEEAMESLKKFKLGRNAPVVESFNSITERKVAGPKAPDGGIVH